MALFETALKDPTGSPRGSGSRRLTRMRTRRGRRFEKPKPQSMQHRQFGKQYKQQGGKVQAKEQRIILCIMGRDQKQADRNAGQPFLGRCILCTFVDLFPQSQLVVCTSVGLERCSSDIVEHEIRKGHVAKIDEGPGSVLLHSGDDVEEDFGEKDENDVDDPGAFVVDPISVGVETCGLVDELFGSFFDSGDGDEGGRTSSTVRWPFDRWWRDRT